MINQLTYLDGFPEDIPIEYDGLDGFGKKLKNGIKKGVRAITPFNGYNVVDWVKNEDLPEDKAYKKGKSDAISQDEIDKREHEQDIDRIMAEFEGQENLTTSALSAGQIDPNTMLIMGGVVVAVVLVAALAKKKDKNK